MAQTITSVELTEYLDQMDVAIANIKRAQDGLRKIIEDNSEERSYSRRTAGMSDTAWEKHKRAMLADG